MTSFCITTLRNDLSATLIVMGLGLLPGWCLAWQLEGEKTITAHTRDQQHIVIGAVRFTPAGDGSIGFQLSINHDKFTDYFLSMKEFKCLGNAVEVTCHVPYPYRHPAKITPDNYAWLEHNLLFLFKLPAEFGAKLWNGLYYKFRLTDNGLVGEPMAIDLNHISAPPDDLTTPPYGPQAMDRVPLGARWLESITVQ
jgi:hypothetical protein